MPERTTQVDERASSAPRAQDPSRASGGLHTATASPRIVIEAVTPEIDGGRFAVKRTVGEQVRVEADVFADGHDTVVAQLLYRYRLPGGENEWNTQPMRPLGNDRWAAEFGVDRVGDYEYTVQGWVDPFATWQQELSKKVEADLDVSSELLEGAEQILEAARHLTMNGGSVEVERGAPAAAVRQVAGDDLDGPVPAMRDRLLHYAQCVGSSDEQVERASAALSEELSTLMSACGERAGAATYARILRVEVNGERARFGSWYEMFPRSAGPDPTRSATFAEAALRLPDIAGMGFDVLYLPPIHPIGRSFRKGPNNSLTPGPNAPGSPWAIGAEEGGHKAVHPDLGTIEDFDRFVATAARLGLEIALDLAYQVSPDHPYVKQHPQWFRHRPDGTIKYAENPPKKYQDIYPLDFQSADRRSLWEELKSIVEFWLSHGVRIFRVDNPHTKPFRFWEWMIADVRSRYPDVIFLSEAFTRPKVMRHLAKLGFQQSYTYFTWRNTKAELTEYFTELTQTDVREYMRPNLFANTPDILHAYLQEGGPPAFQVRLILAATLGASYGIYSGFEVCENRALKPGSEEYLDSEKYQYREWDWSRPGNITELIARVNEIRRAHRALQSDWGLHFHDTDNEEIIFYSKTSPDMRETVLMVVNLDPHNMQHGWVQVPIRALGISDDAPYVVYDLLSDEHYTWRGEWNYVRLEPAVRPAHILIVEATHTIARV